VALILDTNALSAFADGDPKLLRVIEDCAQPAMPVIVLGEYLYGIRQSRYRARYEQWLKTNLPLFDLLAVEAETADNYAELRRELKTAGHPIPSNDLWIAALAREHQLTVISRDAHFDIVAGVRRLPW
jgi:predicted nucleic acid-binding protein